MEGREVEVVKPQEVRVGGGGSKRTGEICEESGRGVLGEGTVRRERGRRGQDGKGVINGGRAARRMDEEGEMEHRREREYVKLLCTSLTSWTESAQLLNREMGK